MRICISTVHLPYVRPCIISDCIIVDHAYSGLNGGASGGNASAAKGGFAVTCDSDNGSNESIQGLESPPLRWKLMAIVLVTAIGFGSQWSSGITSAMKSTIKKELKVNNKQFALLEASEDFMVTVLMLFSGVITDRIGGASKD